MRGTLRNKTMVEWILPYYLYCLSGLSDAGQTLCPPIHNNYQLTGCSVQLFDWLECTELAWFLSKEVFYLNFPKIRKHFPGKYCVCLDFISSTILTKPAAARLPGTKNTASFQAFCVSPAYCRNELGFGISLHLYLHDDNQQTREKLS